MKTNGFFLILALCFVQQVFAQSSLFEHRDYPQGYFQWPVRASIELAANFGELRPNHYHMGLDCKTNRRENLPVLAAADGYVAKVKIEPYGFGRAIYINHPNGTTTLYAHLNEFYPELEHYITEQQYRLEQWKVFLDIPEGLLKVKKGDFIANSGNTGGSQGPHLHFEIRDTKTDKVLNPMLFGFPINDRVAPDILRLAVYDRNKSTYEQSPRIIGLKKAGGAYTTTVPEVLVSTDKVSFAITSYDRYTGSTNQNGIYRAELLEEGRAVCGFEMDSISYDETRYLNAHIDHAFRFRGGSYLEHLSRLPGNPSGIYRGGDGVIQLKPGESKQMQVRVYDANGNESTLNFIVRRSGNPEQVVEPARLFLPNVFNVFDEAEARFYLPGNALYDRFGFVYNQSPSVFGGRRHQLHDPSVPVHVYFPVSLKGQYPLTDTGKIIMKRSFGSKDDYKKATYENGWYRAMFREFGYYELIRDTEAPVVVPVGFRDGMKASALKKIIFRVTDNTEEIRLFRAELDGKWLRFSNDKGRSFVYEFDERCGPGNHELRLVVEDLAGNRTEKRFQFTR